MGKVEWSLLLGSLMLMFCSSCTGLWGRKSASLPLGFNHNDNHNHNYNGNGNLKGGWGSGCNNSTSNRNSGSKAGPEAVCAACGLTTYKAMCEKRLMSYSGAQSATPPELVIMSLRLALDAVEQAYGVAIKLLHNASSSSSSLGAIRDCMQLMDDSSDQLSLSIAAILALLPSQTRERRANVEQEIENALFSASAALTYQSTCTDGLREQNQNGPASLAMSQVVNNVCCPLVTIALQLVAHLGSHLCSWQDHYSQNGHPSDHPQYPAC